MCAKQKASGTICPPDFIIQMNCHDNTTPNFMTPVIVVVIAKLEGPTSYNYIVTVAVHFVKGASHSITQ